MLRYYLIATLIVVAIGSLLFARRLAAPDLRVSAQPTGTPSVPRADTRNDAAGAREFTGSGTWVLSALPNCFEERSRARGAAAIVAAKIPSHAARIAPGTTLRSGACTIVVRPDEVWAQRGADRLRVPTARLYRSGGLLVLVTRTDAAVEIRRYRTLP